VATTRRIQTARPCVYPAIGAGSCALIAQSAVVIMPSTHLPKPSSAPEIPPGRSARPRFHHRCTDDRIREGSGRPPSFSLSTSITKGRKSVFRELGIDNHEPRSPCSNERAFTELTGLASPTSTHAPEPPNNTGNDKDRSEMERQHTQQGQSGRDGPQSEPTPPSTAQRPWYSRLARARRPRARAAGRQPDGGLQEVGSLE
jgi:hypothetical protein